jgi:hypothetical protein
MVGRVLPSACTPLSGFPGEYLYYKDFDGDIHQLYGRWDEDDNGAQSLNWFDQDLTAQTGGPVAFSDLASFSDASGQQVYFVGSDQHVYRIYSQGGNLVKQDLSRDTTLGLSGTPVTGLSDSSGELVFYFGADNDLHKLHCDRGSDCTQNSWINQDVTKYYGGPVVGRNWCGHNLTSFSDVYGESLFYVASDNALHRMSSSAGDQNLVPNGPEQSCPIQN